MLFLRMLLLRNVILRELFFDFQEDVVLERYCYHKKCIARGVAIISKSNTVSKNVISNFFENWL